MLTEDLDTENRMIKRAKKSNNASYLRYTEKRVCEPWLAALLGFDGKYARRRAPDDEDPEENI